MHIAFNSLRVRHYLCVSLTVISFAYKVVDYLIDPFLAGTSASDPESLSVSN